MAYHESALDAIFEDSLSDSQVEEGEIAEDDHSVAEFHAMDVDAVHGQHVSAEEGEILENDPPSAAFPDKPEEHGIIECGKVDDHYINGDSGRDEDSARPPRQKKRKKRSGKKRPKTVNVAQFVRETCNHLQEKKYPLVWAAVKTMGVDGVRNLVKEVDAIEKFGGQMTNDGKRRRTPGGVMWNILRGRVQPAVYKEIMSQGNEVQKQKVKEAKETLKRNRMDVDEPCSNKRQKLAVKEVDMAVPVANRKEINQTPQLMRPASKLMGVTDGPQRDNSLLPAVQLQKAWVDGIRKKEKLDGTAMVPASSLGADLDLKVGTVASTLPEKKSAPLIERLRVPVQYSDLVKEKKPVSLSEGQKESIEHSDLLEGTLLETTAGKISKEQQNDRNTAM